MKLTFILYLFLALRIHVSPECKAVLDTLGGYDLEERGPVTMKVSEFLLELKTYQSNPSIHPCWPCILPSTIIHLLVRHHLKPSIHPSIHSLAIHSLTHLIHSFTQSSRMHEFSTWSEFACSANQHPKSTIKKKSPQTFAHLVNFLKQCHVL